MDSASNSSGFSNHVLGQLHEISSLTAGRGRGNRGRSRGQPASRSAWSQQPPTHEHYTQPQPGPLNTTPEAFPPLGSKPPPPIPRSVGSNQLGPHYQSLPQPPTYNDARHGTPREYQERARGNRRSVRHFGVQQQRPQDPSQQPSQSNNTVQFHTDTRPPQRHGQLFNPNASMHYGTSQQQRAMRHLIMKQSDYLAGIGRKAYDEYKFAQEEKDIKDGFRLGLEDIARNALGAKYPDLQLDQVKLKCYGSLANGFALKNCDMDLLLSLPQYGVPAPKPSESTMSTYGEHVDPSTDAEDDHAFKSDVQRILEKAFLDHEYGARLLTQTRVPILRICQSPTPDLLTNLRKARAEWEKSIDRMGGAQEAFQESEVSPAELNAVEEAVTDLSLNTNTAPAKRSTRGNVGLEFTDDCGIQCDINFSNFVALHNSTMLRLYQSFDPRVKEIGIFVKIWAKIRDINTPYRGTLSSYGWILMVLHYLMNVANPPVIPNLQYLAKIEDSWNPDRQIELFEGFDVRFVQDPQSLEEIRQEMAANRNRESTGQLVRGFFQYYATNQGFHWTRDVISIRTKGGIISKQAKGWTEARWQQGQNKSVRNRYLVAIEDPFEIEHNIARTVGHHGVVTIRNEFRRAWGIIEKIGTDDEVPAEEFLNPVTDRVDTLKKDQDAFRQRQMQMRQEIEAKEKAMLQHRDAENTELHTDGTWGDPDDGRAQAYTSPDQRRAGPDSKLTSIPATQDRRSLKPPGRWRRRKITTMPDEEDDLSGQAPGQAEAQPNADIPTTSQAPETLNEGLTSRAEVLLANGFDRDGNPIPWDLETQEGRWLHWRDHKRKIGGFFEFNSPTLRELDEHCPYDSRRPSPYIGNPYRRKQPAPYQPKMEKPPWPANKAHTLAIDHRTAQTTQRKAQEIPGQEIIGGVGTEGLRSQKNDNPESTFEVTAAVKRSDPRDSPRFERNEVGTEKTGSDLAQRPLSETYVGNIIRWDRNTRGGRWLRTRDSRIRRGTWWEPSRASNYSRLSRAFPFNPEMTSQELEDKNALLRQYHMNSIRRQKSPCEATFEDFEPPQIAEQTPAHTPYHDAASMTETSLTQSAGPNHDEILPHSTPAFSSTTPNQIDQSPDAVPGSDDYPSNDTVSDRAPITPADHDRVPDTQYLRIRRLAFFDKYLARAKSEIGANDQFYDVNAESVFADQNSEMSNTPVLPRGVVIPLRPQEMTLPRQVFGTTNAHDSTNTQKVHQASLESERIPSKASVEVSDSPIRDSFPLRVPATLYPGIDANKRPRDENPDIMPIPRSLGFQFDPRQMQDLAIISKGGNGCAREGAQFNVEEEEYEWGGGGMMGHKESTGPQVSGICGAASYEAGRGDEQGLLDELPRSFDRSTTMSTEN